MNDCVHVSDIETKMLMNSIDPAVLNQPLEEIRLNADELSQIFSDQIRRQMQKLCQDEVIFRVAFDGLDLTALGPTPNGRISSPLSEFTKKIQILLLSLVQAVGHVYTYAAMKQAGKLVQHIYPLKAFEKNQTAASSKTSLDWHCEHAGLKVCPDYLFIFCLRNNDDIGTWAGSPNLSKLSYADRKNLSGLGKIYFGDELFEYPVLMDGKIRFDSLFLTSNDKVVMKSLESLTNCISNSRVVVPQIPGTVIALPNRRVAHGRGAFKARYDGTDRWLIRSFGSLKPVSVLV